MKSFFGYLVCLALLGDKKVAFAKDETELVAVENRMDAIQSSLNLMLMKILLLNMTILTQQADEIISNQQYCANHETLKNLILDLPAKCGAFNSTPKPPEVTNSIQKPPEVIYKSCSDVPQRSGVYYLAVNGSGKHYKAYCEMNKFGGGWTVFQKRQDGTVDFNRSWNEYRDGFGDASGEYWLGLETLHDLTFGKPHELLVILENFNGSTSYIRYDLFFVKNEKQMYPAFFVGASSGNASNALVVATGVKFATYDAPGGSYKDCARGYSAGFWFHRCESPVFRSNLNGVYGTSLRVNGIWWYRSFRGYSYDPLKGAQMMIRLHNTNKAKLWSTYFI